MELNWRRVFFLMKGIRIVQVNLVDLDDSLHSTLEKVKLQELVNSTGKRGFPSSNINGLTYTLTQRERENE